ncbi:uncharacterized protein A4U43_C01F10020 [Asparagus officinalis]|uniref:Uncharacterized protein n=1 Tax=Asparagus officinalis TaxID=4686 RepID=A0A5P1FNT7_ASPOF|nr:uncharacterized protein A4U43_C01F10020 [Asparagus officinalis]
MWAPVRRREESGSPRFEEERGGSAVRLARGDNERALEDAEEACRIAPVFPQGYICQGDAFMAMEEWAAAEEAYSNALLIDPSIHGHGGVGCC